MVRHDSTSLSRNLASFGEIIQLLPNFSQLILLMLRPSALLKRPWR